MTSAEIRELLKTVQIKPTNFPHTFLIRNLTRQQLLEIFLLAQSQLCELESRVPVETPNPS